MVMRAWSTLRRWVDPFIVMLLTIMAIAFLFPARGSFFSFVQTVATVGIAVLFLVYGMRISTSEAIKGLTNWRLHSTILASTYVLFPILGLLIHPLAVVLVGNKLAMGMLYLTLLPSTVQASIAFTSIAKGNVAAAICGASLSNILGMFITPVYVTIFLHGAGAGLQMSMVLTILAQMLAPFIIGQCLQPWVGDWVRSHRWITIISDRGVVAVVVYSTFSAGVTGGIWSSVAPLTIVYLLVGSAVLLAVVLPLTWWVGAKLGFPRADRIALLMCGSKKSMATGVPMATVLFAGQPGLASIISLPLMIFHQVQLFTCAIIARRLGASEEQIETVLDDDSGG